MAEKEDGLEKETEKEWPKRRKLKRVKKLKNAARKNMGLMVLNVAESSCKRKMDKCQFNST